MASVGAWKGLLTAGALCGAALGCGNNSGISTGTPTPGASPTPTPGAATYSLSPNPSAPQFCNLSTVQETWTANFVVIDITSTSFTPNWGQPGSYYLVAPSGTLSGNGFSAKWTYCSYDSLAGLTTKHVWTWTGTLAPGDASFTSAIQESLTNASGDMTASCASVSQSMSDCTSPGLTWQLSGTKQ